MTTFSHSFCRFAGLQQRPAVLLLSAILISYLSIAQNAVQIDSTGNVRIGMATVNKLAVTGKANFTDTVAIGTLASPRLLTVSGSVVVGFADNTALAVDAGAEARLGFIKKYGKVPHISSGSATPIIFSQSSEPNITTNINTATLTERMRIAADGKVGIGRESPGAELDVNGRIKDETGYVTPRGGIIMYTGTYSSLFDATGKGKSATNVEGWAVCNGQNGTPDLRGRFVVGAGPGSGYGDNTGLKGGNAQHTITINEMPSHNHSSGVGGGGGNGDKDNKNNRGSDEGYAKSNPAFKTYTSTEGSGQSFDMRPPYYAVFYIMKL
ncbi:MAG: hypothetical protein ABW019_00600 [Chitinophagaceae bacterium]